MNQLLLWIKATRAPYFTVTLIPVLLGAVIAYGDLAVAGQSAHWNWLIFVMAIIGAISAHAATNLANDYGDHLSGNDEANQTISQFNGGSRVIQDGLLRPSQVIIAAATLFTATIIIGLILNMRLNGAAFSPTPLLWIGITGCVLGASYTLGPFRLSYKGIGEVAVGLGFGPVMVLGTHYVLSFHAYDQWAWVPPLLASIPPAIFVFMIIWINQFQDVPADRQVNKLNWVVRLTDNSFNYRKPMLVYRVFGILGFASIAVLFILGLIDDGLASWYSVLALLPLPLFLSAQKFGKDWLDKWKQDDANHKSLSSNLLQVNASTVKLHLFTGILLVLAYALRVIFGG